MHLKHTGECRDSHLFVEKTFTLRICQIPDLKRYTHTRVTAIINSRETSKLCQQADPIMYSLSQEPDRPDLISSGTQLHQPLPLAHCRSDRPVHSKHVQIQQLSKTAPEKGFQSKYQEFKSTCNVYSCPVEQKSLIEFSRYQY